MQFRISSKEESQHRHFFYKSAAFRSRLEAATHFSRRWRVGIAIGLLLTSIILVLNLALLAWAVTGSHPHDQYAIYTVLDRACDNTDTYLRWSRLGINCLSTLLLVESYYAIQVLFSPTRKEIDAAHAQGIWVDVGVISWRNLRYISRWRTSLVAVFLVSSAIVHYQYNPIILKLFGTNEYGVFFVDPTFISGNSTNGSLTPDNEPYSRLLGLDVQVILAHLQNQAANNLLKRLENVDCIRTFEPAFQTEFRNVLVVARPRSESSTNGSDSGASSNTTYPVKWAQKYTLHEASWICALDDACRPSQEASHAAVWTLPETWRNRHADESSSPPSERLAVDHCLAEPAPRTCQVQLNLNYLIVVIVATFIKFLCFVAIRAYVVRFELLISVGDVVRSFLKHPCAATRHVGPLSRSDFKSGRWKGRTTVGMHFDHDGTQVEQMTTVEPWPWHPMRRRFWFKASPSAWALGLTGWLILWFVLLAALIYGCVQNQYVDVQQMYSQGFSSSTNRNPIVKNSIGITLLNAVMIVNLPQFYIALAYVLTHNTLARMEQSHWLSQFSTRYEGLSVDHPRPPHHWLEDDGDDQEEPEVQEQDPQQQQEHQHQQRRPASSPRPVYTPHCIQRANYWLNTSPVSSLLLQTLTTVLHWLLSQSFFVFAVEEHHLSLSPSTDPVTQSYGMGWSAFGLFLCLMPTTILVLILLIMGLRRHSSGMPIVATCSLAIAACCRLPDDKAPERTVRLPLRFGRIFDAAADGDEEGREEETTVSVGEGGAGRQVARIGFSTEDVEALVPGRLYY